ncbi:MAG: hypothetical protein JWN20_893, partial [Jatrophihabitantaceae bacterium]|nr:hypothetical protein [Jatrophihabitantaceae bacterium]
MPSPPSRCSTDEASISHLGSDRGAVRRPVGASVRRA